MMKTQIDFPARCEVLWHMGYDEKCKSVERWLPATAISLHSAIDREEGRIEVRADCGFYASDAAPECVRF